MRYHPPTFVYDPHFSFFVLYVVHIPFVSTTTTAWMFFLCFIVHAFSFLFDGAKLVIKKTATNQMRTMKLWGMQPDARLQCHVSSHNSASHQPSSMDMPVTANRLFLQNDSSVGSAAL